MNWSWMPNYAGPLVQGLSITLLVLGVSVIVGFLLAISLGFVQLTPRTAAGRLSIGFCNLMRGTPLLLQLYMLYYGLGSLLPLLPRESFGWLMRLDAIYYVLLAFTLNFAGYEAVVLRAAFLAVPRGEIEAAQSLGLSSGQVFWRIWFPAAVSRVLPTLAGDVVAQLKSTPLAFTVPVMDLMGVAHRIMQDTALYFEPLILVALVYVALAACIMQVFAVLERKVRRVVPA